MTSVDSHISKWLIVPLAFISIIILVSGCSSSKPYTLHSIKTFDPDTSEISKPPENESYQYWDRVDNTIFHQLKKPLDLNRLFRAAGRAIGVAKAKQADNVNHLDEVPESSWYNYRHFYNHMTPEELAQGPNTVEPDISGSWTIFSAKMEGANPGFFIEDSKGNRFLIKFDGSQYPELTTSAEVIGTKIFYAAGYNVPESIITYFDPDQVTIGEGVTIMDKGEERPMTMEDYRDIVEDKPKNRQGKIRALASKFVDGTPLGPWRFEGTNDEDPNDRVDHEHRREIRGMRVISSWLNDTDRRDANTMSVYTSQGYIKHLVQDFGNTLGANGASIHEPIYGQAYLIDPRYMALNAISLGMNVNSWETINTQVHIPYPSVGYFRADVFKPGQWVSAHPLPAYENMTLRDAFWGAKQVMSFSDEDIRAIVGSGQITNPKAEEYIAKVLIKRRDKIGRYWLSRINPIDKFQVHQNDSSITLTFKDLGIEGNLFETTGSSYEYSVSLADRKNLLDTGQTNNERITINRRIIPEQESNKNPLVLNYEIITRRKNSEITEKRTSVYIALESFGPRVVGIQREE